MIAFILFIMNWLSTIFCPASAFNGIIAATANVDVDCDKLQRVIHDELSNRNYNGYLIVNQEQEVLYKEAEKMHLTVNQYLLWKYSQEQNNNINLNDIKQQSVDNLIDNNKTGINQMFPGEWCRFGSNDIHEVTQSGIQKTSPSSVDSSNPKDGSNTNSQHNGWNSGWDSGDSWSDYCDR